MFRPLGTEPLPPAKSNRIQDLAAIDANLAEQETAEQSTKRRANGTKRRANGVQSVRSLSPPYARQGVRTFYRLAAIEEWLRAKEVDPSKAAAPASSNGGLDASWPCQTKARQHGGTHAWNGLPRAHHERGEVWALSKPAGQIRVTWDVLCTMEIPLAAAVGGEVNDVR
jgi:hypothetical protein